MKLPGLRQMKAAAKPGECPFCDRPLDNNPTGRKAHTCGEPECRTAWMRCWKRDQRAALAAVVKQSRRVQSLLGGQS
jgi:hypothetical protein